MPGKIAQSILNAGTAPDHIDCPSCSYRNGGAAKKCVMCKAKLPQPVATYTEEDPLLRATHQLDEIEAAISAIETATRTAGGACSVSGK